MSLPADAGLVARAAVSAAPMDPRWPGRRSAHREKLRLVHHSKCSRTGGTVGTGACSFTGLDVGFLHLVQAARIMRFRTNATTAQLARIHLRSPT